LQYPSDATIHRLDSDRRKAELGCPLFADVEPPKWGNWTTLAGATSSEPPHT
jgi:hypothetical protein